MTDTFERLRRWMRKNGHPRGCKRYSPGARVLISDRPLSVDEALQGEVRRWYLALCDAIELGLTHLVKGRHERLRLALTILNDHNREDEEGLANEQAW